MMKKWFCTIYSTFSLVEISIKMDVNTLTMCIRDKFFFPSLHFESDFLAHSNDYDLMNINGKDTLFDNYDKI